MLDRPDTTAIRRLRLVGGTNDQLACQLDMQRALSQSRRAPAGLPDTAIMCVRRVRVSVPRRASQGEQAQVALQSALDGLARGAARPVRGAVPPQAEAVVFADRAELLACLARDHCAGRAAECWWWRGLFRTSDMGTAVAVAWLDTPEYAPAALDLLAMQGLAVQFAGSLGHGVAQALLRALIERFALPALRPLLESPGWLGPLAPTAQPQLAAPWLPWAPESRAVVPEPAQQWLLGVGLMLHRAPVLLRAPAFARAVEIWLHSADSAAEPPALPAKLPPDTLVAPIGQQTQPPAALPSLGESPLGDAEHRPAPPASMTDIAAAATDLPTSAAMPIPASPQHAPSATTAQAAPLPATPPEPPDGIMALEEFAVPFDRPLIDTQIDTAFGGLFYLLNLALELELYGDFTRPAEPGIALPIWDFLALVGLELLGQPLRADPIWALLARLAQRTPEHTPGQDFAPPEDWRLPPAWLAPFSIFTVLRCNGESDRLRVIHPAGFALLDIARNGDPQQLSAELRAYGPDLGQSSIVLSSLETCQTPMLRRAHSRMKKPSGGSRFSVLGSFSYELPWPAAPATPLDRWLGWLMPYLFARLRRALGEASDQAITELVCAHQARVRVATVRLDIVLSLAELPIAIRLCGLDRDPGWIPAAGRMVAFHFE